MQGEFVNLDKIDEEDLDPGSDDEQIQIRIEDVKPTVPVNITKNGGRELTHLAKSWATFLRALR